MQISSKVTPLLIAACALSTGAGRVFAHEGHGLQGSHWHATDAWGLVGMVALVALATWLTRGKK